MVTTSVEGLGNIEIICAARESIAAVGFPTNSRALHSVLLVRRPVRAKMKDENKDAPDPAPDF